MKILVDILEIRGLKKYFPVEQKWMDRLMTKKQRWIRAVDSIDLTVERGETLSLVGESGSGKTTTARMIMQTLMPTEGEVYFEGREIFTMNKKERKKLRYNMQMIFQNPYASLNPRMTVENIVGEPITLHTQVRGEKKRKKIIELLETVGLSPGERFIDRYPHEFSGGERQRISIARAIALKPKLLIADEPVSSLDVSIQATILNLLQDLKSSFNMTYVLIAHNLAIVRHMSDKLAIMYLGKIVEKGISEKIFQNPRHPYTKALISAFPELDLNMKRERSLVKGEMPSSITPPPGCRFHTRCPYSFEICEKSEPVLYKVEDGHTVACHLTK